MKPFDFTTNENSYEVITYDSVEDLALIEKVFVGDKIRFLLVKQIRYMYGSYQFYFIEGFETEKEGYEAYLNRVNGFRAEGTI